MKRILPLFFLLLNFSAFAQVHQSLLLHLNDLPAFPVTTTEAYSKCTSQQTGACDADTILTAFNAKHFAITKQLNSTIMANSNTTMPDTSFVHQVENMTPEQQKAWAMQYAMQQAAAAAAQPVKLPSAGETQFLKEYSASISTQSAFFDSITFPWQRFTNEYTTRVKELTDKYNLQMGKCHHSDNGQGDGGVDPVCGSGVEKQYQGWLQSFYADWLSRVEKFVAAKKTEMQTRFGSMENILAQNNYMSNPSNSVYRTDACGLQQTILSAEFSLSQIMIDVWSDGCKIKNTVSLSEQRAASLTK